MKIVKITSLGCPSCIIMNKVFNQIKEEYTFELEEYDFDFDDIEKLRKYVPNHTIDYLYWRMKEND